MGSPYCQPQPDVRKSLSHTDLDCGRILTWHWTQPVARSVGENQDIGNKWEPHSGCERLSKTMSCLQIRTKLDKNGSNYNGGFADQLPEVLGQGSVEWLVPPSISCMTTTLDLTKLRYHIKTPRYQIILCDTAWIRVMQSTHARRSQATQSTSATPWHFLQGGQLAATISTLEGTNLNIESCKSSLYCTPVMNKLNQRLSFDILWLEMDTNSISNTFGTKSAK